ncbi:MAG: GIY-YIG nuclease family protein [Myxacorys californica WJT36-NPBG1]|jgi:hypothetical protein|nr:GIY-YIG nuclease family protein [Myxacorys californica WJT36-NPBG1]
MIDPQTINPLALPSVPLELRSQLPETPCIYFAINSLGQVQYIGRSANPKRRWGQTDKLGEYKYTTYSNYRGHLLPSYS